MFRLCCLNKQIVTGLPKVLKNRFSETLLGLKNLSFVVQFYLKLKLGWKTVLSKVKIFIKCCNATLSVW